MVTTINFKVLKASEFGLPQNRQKSFFLSALIAQFNDDFFNWDTIKKSKDQLETKDAIGDLLPCLETQQLTRIIS